MVVIGPEDPLANGIVDALAPLGIQCFGPKKAGAEIEANKSWSKKFMMKYQIPTARFQPFNDAAAAKEFIKRCLSVQLSLHNLHLVYVNHLQRIKKTLVDYTT